MSELSNTNSGYNEWLNKLEKLSDTEIAYELHDRIMNHSNLDDESKEIFDLSFQYCMKLIKNEKPLETNLLKIYLEDVHHKNVSRIDTVVLFTLLNVCGINFKS
ncbi:MAG: hypothetical protein [Wendovervirus sonii]|uniref:Bacteriocin immunity protein n=1 Tax=phage Lak_Megaphage_Sonny TaxID=3109229 RepID=A0ABZ0Z350_9CAUD|nr:MAG: hypothetical protein [phage Lak_Megaphage_Sonny]